MFEMYMKIMLIPLVVIYAYIGWMCASLRLEGLDMDESYVPNVRDKIVATCVGVLWLPLIIFFFVWMLLEVTILDR